MADPNGCKTEELSLNDSFMTFDSFQNKHIYSNNNNNNKKISQYHQKSDVISINSETGKIKNMRVYIMREETGRRHQPWSTPSMTQKST